jgi:hypothetical protein
MSSTNQRVGLFVRSLRGILKTNHFRLLIFGSGKDDRTRRNSKPSFQPSGGFDSETFFRMITSSNASGRDPVAMGIDTLLTEIAGLIALNNPSPPG